MEKIKEKILIDRCKNGDVAAFEELISGYEKRVFNIIYRIIGDYNEAEDISQEVFIKVFRTIKNFKEKSSFYTWLYRVAVNECINVLKERRKIYAYSVDSPIKVEDDEIIREIRDDKESPEKRFEYKELRACLEDALNRISYEHRMMIVLRDIQGFSYEEIAEIMQCPTGTVKSRISRARKALRELLAENKELFLDYTV